MQSKEKVAEQQTSFGVNRINWGEELGQRFRECFRQESKRHGWEIKKIRWPEEQGRPVTICFIQIVKIAQEKGWKQNEGEEITHCVSQEHLPELEVMTHSKPWQLLQWRDKDDSTRGKRKEECWRKLASKGKWQDFSAAQRSYETMVWWLPTSE